MASIILKEERLCYKMES